MAGGDAVDFMLGERSRSVLTDTVTGEQIPFWLDYENGVKNPRHAEIMGDP